MSLRIAERTGKRTHVLEIEFAPCARGIGGELETTSVKVVNPLQSRT